MAILTHREVGSYKGLKGFDASLEMTDSAHRCEDMKSSNRSGSKYVFSLGILCKCRFLESMILDDSIQYDKFPSAL